MHKIKLILYGFFAGLINALSGSGGGLIAVKTASPIPKSLVFDCMKEINSARAKEDVKIGDVIIKNVLGTGVDIVASGNKMKN